MKLRRLPDLSTNTLPRLETGAVVLEVTMKVKMKRESVWGPAGKVIEVEEGTGYNLIQQGAATEVKPKQSKRKTSNKALTASKE